MVSIPEWIIIYCGDLERTSCMGCGSGFQPRNEMIAAESHSHSGLFYGKLDFTDKRLIDYRIFVRVMQRWNAG